MTQNYYRYNSDDSSIDFNNDEIYDYVLDRENLKELDNIGPKNQKDFSQAWSDEHFGNLKNRSLGENLFLIIFVLFISYLLYSNFCTETTVNSKMYKAMLV